ncbi:MAG: Asp-tRNA(Asn)/Glu-tRNA(Gln) amidotransferase subunit GatB [Candidatus Bathyarchaeia archaeon]
MDVKIGLEIHCQLTNLRTKLFCNCSSDYRGDEPNTHICPICMGLPGTLPLLNEKALEDGVAVALALNSEIQPKMTFYRKNYFYPDMPKNFQISQFDGGDGVPIAKGGFVDLDVGRRIKIRRIQIEEDPAKLVYSGTIDTAEEVLIDYNRAGIALVEIVTEPDIRTPREARLFLQKLRDILEFLGVSDGSLEGSMRCDANISLGGGTRVEIKNISSFKEVERALRFEITRQKRLSAEGLTVQRETRHWDESRRITVSLRVKETEEDYRYFPEPDIMPVVVSEQYVDAVRGALPELPHRKKDRYVEDLNVPVQNAAILSRNLRLSQLFERCVGLGADPVEASNWIVGDLLSYLRELDLSLEDPKVRAEHLVEMLRLIEDGLISGKIAKEVLLESLKTGKSPKRIVEERGLMKIGDEELLERLVEEVFRENRRAVLDARLNEEAVNYLIGQVMKKTAGKADPVLTSKLVRLKLSQIEVG